MRRVSFGRIGKLCVCVTGEGRQGSFGANRDGRGLATCMAALGDYRKLELRAKTKHNIACSLVNNLFTCRN